MGKRLLTVSMALLVGACGQSKATVECQAQPGVGVEGSESVNLCWTLSIDCKNGTRATADACQRVEPMGKASKLIGIDQIKNAAACDMATGVSVVAKAEL